MKYFIFMSAVIVAASALPTEIGNQAGNESFYSRNAGLAGFGAGTVGGAGGAVWTVWDAWALRDAIAGDDPRIIYVRGRIDLTPLFTGSPGVLLQVGSFKSIIGGDSNAEIHGGGLGLSGRRHIIVQNIKLNNPLSYAPGEQPNGNGGIINQQPGPWSFVDALDVSGSEMVWIDHCEFSDDPWNVDNTPESIRRHDGLIDITRGSSFVTVSNNIFRNHNMVTLVGNSDVGTDTGDIGRLKVSFYLNWYTGVVQRTPLIRFGEVHVLNNLFTDVKDYCIGVGTSSQVYAERNVFINIRRAWGLALVHPHPAGAFFNDNNLLVNSVHDNDVSSNVNWRPSQYYGYNPMNPANVEAHVRRYAGTW